jgi:hypothetical protein
MKSAGGIHGRRHARAIAHECGEQPAQLRLWQRANNGDEAIVYRPVERNGILPGWQRQRGRTLAEFAQTKTCILQCLERTGTYINLDELGRILWPRQFGDTGHELSPL